MGSHRKVGVMAEKKNPSSRRYPPEMRERAVRMVQQSIEESGERWGVVSRVARQLGIGEQTLRNWVERADIDAGKRQVSPTRARDASLSWKKGSVSYVWPMPF
jgi:transposase-like protein